MKRLFGVALIVLSVIFSVLIVMEGVKVFDTDIESSIKMQNTSADLISNIRSVGGRTLDEAYYLGYGNFLKNQTSVSQSQFLLIKNLTMILGYLGLMFCCASLLSGIWLVIKK